MSQPANFNSTPMYSVNPFENYDITEIFNGKRPPIGFYRKSKNRIRVIRYFVEILLGKLGNDRLHPVSIEEFKTHHIYGLLTTYYNCAPRKAIEEAYSEELKDFNLFSDPLTIIPAFFNETINEPPRSFWKNTDHRIATTKYFIENILKLSPDKVYDVTAKMFQKNGLNGFLTHYYNSSPIKAIKEAYPNTKSFLFNRIDKKDWEDREFRVETCKYFIETLLNISQDSDILLLSMKKLTSVGLKHTLARFYGGDIKNLISDIYPHINLDSMKIKGKKNI